jgi:NAD(P)-dependent dehydrogenase (short-subunit alcohol dehydrogenase family)
MQYSCTNWADPTLRCRTLQAIAFDPDSQMGTAAPAQGAYSPTYSVAKAMLNKAVELLAQDAAVKARGIRVASTCPGWCRWVGCAVLTAC